MTLHPIRRRYIGAGLIVPDPYLSMPPLSPDELLQRGFEAAARAARSTPAWSRAR